MKPTVHILATCERVELLGNTLLVFETLRVGFPTARVVVWIKLMAPELWAAIEGAAKGAGCEVRGVPAGTRHDEWVKERIMSGAPSGGAPADAPEVGPIWLVDTDVVFWESVEVLADGHLGDAILMGRYEPAWLEEWTGTERVARLHTCCLYVECARVRHELSRWLRQFPAGLPLAAQAFFFEEHFVPRAGKRPLFYDTCAGLYQAIAPSGVARAFTPEEDARFEHLSCGCYADAVAERYGGMLEVHRGIWRDVRKARGLREHQEKFYRDQGVKIADRIL